MKASALVFAVILLQSISESATVCGIPNNSSDQPPGGCPTEEDGDSGSSGGGSGSSGGNSGPSSGTTGPSVGAPSSGNYSQQLETPAGPIRPNTGGARLMTSDLKLQGAVGDLPMSVKRHYQSRDTTSNADLMGHGRTWTHSYSWRMWASGTDGANRSILFPEGYVLDFAPYPGTVSFEGQTSVKYIPQAGFGHRLYKVGDLWYLLVPGGVRYAFEKVTDPDATVRYVPRSGRDAKGNLHAFTTDGQSRITRVEDATGNWLQFTYSGVQINRKNNINIHTISTAPVVGWNEVTVTTTQPFRWLQGISAHNNYFRMAEIEFHKPDASGTQKLGGSVYGTDPDFSNGNRPIAKKNFRYSEWVLQTERMASGRSSNARIELKSLSLSSSPYLVM